MVQVVPGSRDPTTTQEEYGAVISASPASRRAVESVLVSGGTTGTLTGLVFREGQRRWDDAAEWLGFQERSPMLSAEQATEQYGIEGQMVFTRAVSEREAQWRQAAKRDELARLDILQRNDSVGGLEQLGLSIFGGLVDPVTIPLNFVPALGQGNLMARLGLGGARSGGGAFVRGLTFGALEGAAIGGLQEGAVFGLAGLREGRDYDVQDLMLGVSANALFGGGLRGTLDGLGWRAPDVSLGGSEAPRVTREAIQGLGAGDPIGDMIRTTAADMGEDADTAVAIAMIESRLDPNADNPRSSASGVFQFLTGEGSAWRAMGGGDPFDANLNVRRGIQLMAENRAGLTRTLGRQPEPWELYLAHQQGQGGARQLLRDPNRLAVDALRAAGVKDPAAAVRLNGGDLDMTAGEFAGIWRAKFAETAGGSASVSGFDPVPPEVAMLSPEARLGALSKALGDMEADRAVNVAPLIDIELQGGGRPRPPLDEAAGGDVEIRNRTLDAGEDMAVTVRGTEVPVRYAIVEAEDLVTSHDDDLIRNPAFPDELQPRDRERAGSQARLLRMEKEFNPRRLMASPDAESGAPIIARDGVVESGNGRSIMLRRNMRRGTPVDAAYRAELGRRGFDVEGFDKPVLVRMRTQPMDGQSRVRLAAEMNGDVTERLSATEQAFADARAIDDTDLGLFRGGEITGKDNDTFARRFIDKAGAGQENDLVDGETQRLSQSGVDRIQAAMVARAFGDRSLVYALFETQDNTIKSIGKGLMGAAPDWARMRAASARGELAVGADTTEALTAAVALVRHARENRLKLGELVEDWADQDRLLGGEALSPSTLAYLRTFFLDDAMKRPSSADHIAETLRATAAKALDTTPGPDLFGESHAFDAATILETTSARIREDAGDADASLFGSGAGPSPDADRGGNGEREPEASRGPGSGGRSGGGQGDARSGAGNRPDRQPVAGGFVQPGRPAPMVDGRMQFGDEVESFVLKRGKSFTREADITVYERDGEWGASASYSAPTMGGGGPPRFFDTREEAVAYAVDRLRKSAEGRADFSAADNAAFARIRAWADETFGPQAEAKAAPDAESDAEPAAAPAAPKDPELLDLEGEVAAMEAELASYVERGLLDADDVAELSADRVDQETLQLAIDTAAACLSEGGA